MSTRVVLARLLAAMDECESHRGAFSCVAPHDARCPKSRARRAEDWRGEWVCQCGREELDAALAEAQKLLGSGAGQGENLSAGAPVGATASMLAAPESTPVCPRCEGCAVQWSGR
mgnify:CR=1 FL=1